MGLFPFMAIGLVVGLVAGAVMPGVRGTFVSFARLGVAGSLIGAIVGGLYYGSRVFELHSARILAGILITYAVLFLVGVRAAGKRRRQAF